MENSDLRLLLNEQLQIGNDLIHTLKSFGDIDGVTKLETKIKKEIKFLEKVSKYNVLQPDYVRCSNLSYLSAIVKCLLQESNIVHIFYPVNINQRKIYIDIISNNGSFWIKVIARNKKSLSEAVLGQTTTKIRNVIDHCDDYLSAAKLKLICYKQPQVKFIFTCGIDDFLKLQLEAKGVIVVDSLAENRFRVSNELFSTNYNLDTLNLDVTAMIAYVSNLTNGHSNIVLKEPLLAEQARWERERPMNNILNRLFQQKKLICCETAKTAFETIIQTIGGPEEKTRAKDLLNRVTILQDDLNRNDVFFNGVEVRGRIKPRSKIIFLFGHFLKALTVTANQGFVEAAKQQGFEPVVFFHEPRALTELKQIEIT